MKTNQTTNLINELNQKLEKIAAKKALGLPLTKCEFALWTLYGNTTEAAQ